MTGSVRPATLHAASSASGRRQEGVQLMSLFVWMVLGAVAGWLASQVMKDSGYGQSGEIIIGVVSAVLGGIVAGMILQVNVASGFSIETVIAAFVTALAVIAASRVFKRSRSQA
jgi:uncharacterized membrane protein YeaQ/YmgE (transglycosylase-associated protein family)